LKNDGIVNQLIWAFYPPTGGFRCIFLAEKAKKPARITGWDATSIINTKINK
jgi:hypothetical protein